MGVTHFSQVEGALTCICVNVGVAAASTNTVDYAGLPDGYTFELVAATFSTRAITVGSGISISLGESGNTDGFALGQAITNVRTGDITLVDGAVATSDIAVAVTPAAGASGTGIQVQLYGFLRAA